MPRRGRDTGDKLAEYRGKRDRGKTDEPAGGHTASGDSTSGWRWRAFSCRGRRRRAPPPTRARSAWPSVPRTIPSTTPTTRGASPRASTARATAIVWDTGTYDNLDDDPVATGHERGHVKVWLHGDKLTGGYVLQHTRMRGDEQAWLMVKLDDEGADRRRRPTTTQRRSVLSGRRNEDL